MASLPISDLDVPALLTRLGAKPKRNTADSRQVRPVTSYCGCSAFQFPFCCLSFYCAAARKVPVTLSPAAFN